jgi:hypothetical protein
LTAVGPTAQQEDGKSMVSMGTVWDRTTEFLSDNLSAITSIAFLAIFLPAAISGSLEPLTNETSPTAMAIHLLSLALSIVTLWGQLAITGLALDPGAGKGAATAAASKQLVPVIGLMFILFAGAFVLLLPVPLALAFAGFDFQAAMTSGKPEVPPGITGFLLLYLIFFSIVLFWLGARLILVTPVVLTEGRWFGAFARSFKLTRVIFWKIIGVTLLYVIVWAVSFLAAKLVFGSIFRLIAGGEGLVTVGGVLTETLIAVVLTAFNTFAAAFTGKLYLAVRDAREAIVESI